MKRLIFATIVVGVLAGMLHAAEKKMSTYQTVEINAPAEKVWAILVDANNWAQDNPTVKESKLIEGDGEQVGSVIKCTLVVGGKKARPKFTVSISEKYKKLEYTIDLAMVEGVTGFTLEEKDGITKLTNYEIASGALLKFIKQQDMDTEHLEWANSVKRRAETK